MLRVKDILAAKGREVFSVDKNATALEAAKLLRDKHVGALVVTDGPRVVGIFTERDVVNRLVAGGRDPATTAVHEVMSSPVVCCQLKTSKAECVEVMTARRIRHLPVVEDEQLVGIVSIGDIMAQEVADHQKTIRDLHEYLFGRV